MTLVHPNALASTDIMIHIFIIHYPQLTYMLGYNYFTPALNAITHVRHAKGLKLQTVQVVKQMRVEFIILEQVNVLATIQQANLFSHIFLGHIVSDAILLAIIHVL